MSFFRYGRWVIVFGAAVLFAAAFLPFAMIFIPSPGVIFGIIKPMDVWWFGYPIIITAVGMLILSILSPSRRKCSVFVMVGAVILSASIVIASVLHSGNGDIFTVPYAFLAMLISGLIFIVTGLVEFRRASRLSLQN
jgi:hypothetical protein